MIAVCSNTSLYVGVTILTLVRSCRCVDRPETTRFLAATFPLCTQRASWLCPGVQIGSLLQQHDRVRWCHHLCLVLVSFEPTKILSATEVGIFDRGRERHVRAAARAYQDTCCETVIVEFGSSRAQRLSSVEGTLSSV